jgi:hypothetical protein
MFAPIAFEDLTFPQQTLPKYWSGEESMKWMRAAEVFNSGSAKSPVYGTAVNIGSAITYRGGGSLASNGKVYFPGVVGNSNCYVIDNNDTVTTIAQGQVQGDNSCFDPYTNRVILSSQANVYCIIDTTNDTKVSTFTSNGGGYNGLVLSYEASIMFSPNDYSGVAGVAKVNAATGTQVSVKAQAGNYLYGSMAYNGKMYWGSGDQTTFLEYDPAADTVTTFGSVTAGAFRGVTFHPNGFLYSMGTNNGTILRINPKTREVTTVLTGQNSAFYTCGCVGADGQIYFIGSTTTVVVYNPYTNKGTTITMPAGSWQGIVMRGNGDLIASPWGSGQFVKIPIVKNREYFLANGQNGGGVFGRHVASVG